MFITNMLSRKALFADAAYACEAVQHLYRVQLIHPFFLFGFVIMPDHCHFLVNVLQPGSVSKVMNVYKSGLTFQIGRKKIWQPRFHLVIPQQPWKVLDYIHMNPVKKGLAGKPDQYLWSSACGKWDISPLDE